MKFYLHFPGLMLITLCGLVCSLIGWESAEDYLAEEYERLQGRIL